MILTGPQIAAEVAAGRIVIEDFDHDRIEPNSYGFRLGRSLMIHRSPIVDCAEPPDTEVIELSRLGTVLQPGRVYLGRTVEAMGSQHYAATLYGSRSISTLGVWIQFSAPLGHCGAIFPWTLEITVTCPVLLFPEMVIGKIGFWCMQGEQRSYLGKYADSRSVVASRLSDEFHQEIGR